MRTALQQNLAAAQWTVRPAGDLSHVPPEIAAVTSIPASVPGCVHTDLIDAGLVRDPRVGDAEAETQWVSRTDWRYEASFNADPSLFERDEIELVFDSLDTIAVVELNGVEIGRTSNEFVPHRFSVNGMLLQAENRIAVTFTSPLRYAVEESARLGARPVNGEYPPYNMIRKCASNFEWDWGPRAATCGIAAGVRLEAWSVVRIAAVRVITERREDGGWDAAVHVPLAWSSRGQANGAVSISARIRRGGSTSPDTQRLEIGQPSVELAPECRGMRDWSPHTHGAPYTYALELQIVERDERAKHWVSETLDSRGVRIGFRDARLDTAHDADGSQFSLVVNGNPVFCRGANWIPEGIFPRDRTPEHVRERLMQLKAANMNMVRVWGGGRYEPDWFYDICDELGILVWQDFMFSCACYPEEQPLRSMIEQEAAHHLARLSIHPSVVLWCGGNECEWAYESWGFKEKLAPGASWGAAYYREVLPRLCAELAPSTPYIPNSPFSPVSGKHPNDPSSGDAHTWEVWGDGYRAAKPRFCSEFGQQSPSNIDTLKTAGVLPNEPGGSDFIPPLLAVRQRGPGGNKRWFDEPISSWFRAPVDFDEWHYLAQLIQARSMKIGVEWHRANMPRCMGSLIWQFNDAWPGLSWSLVDSQGHPKPSYFAAQEAFRHRILTIQPFDDVPWLVAVNDDDEPWRSRAKVVRFTLDGDALRSREEDFEIAPRTARRVIELEAVVGAIADAANEYLHAVCPDSRSPTLWFNNPDRQLNYPTPNFESSIVHRRNHSVLRMRANTFVRDLTFHLDRLAPVGRNLSRAPVTLLPGATLTLYIDHAHDTDPERDLSLERVTAPPIMWTANAFGATRPT